MGRPLVLIVEASISDPIQAVNEARMTSASDAETADGKYTGEAISYVSAITKKEKSMGPFMFVGPQDKIIQSMNYSCSKPGGM